MTYTPSTPARSCPVGIGAGMPALPPPGMAGRPPGQLPPLAARAGSQTPGAGVPGEAHRAPGSRTFTIEMPAGLPLLSPNGRYHWAERKRRTQILREAAFWLARKQRLPRLERVSVVVEYQPPDRRRRDADNAASASGKPCIDALVLAGVLEDDDCPAHVADILCTVGPVFPKGRLVLHITEVAP